MGPTTSVPPITEELCEEFASAADALLQRRASDIPEKAIDAFVALGWMRWHGGALRISTLGQMALVRIRARFSQAAA